MKSIKLLCGAGVLLLLLIFLFAQRGNDAEKQAADLLAKSARTTEPTNESLDDKPGEKNQPVPAGLSVEAEMGGIWHVDQPGSDLELILPYAPRHIPSPKEDLAPVGANPGFVGADACQSCHQDRHASFAMTAHYRTSAPATTDSIAGSFSDDANLLVTTNKNVSFKMIQHEGRSFQQVSFFDWQCNVPIDLVTGSSKLGQSYLFWHDDKLFQSHVSYVAEVDAWTNSPGYPDGYGIYSRPVTARCLECHSTWADFRKAPNHFTPGSVIFGISCERCHGPGKQHVEYHQQNPNQKEARHIIHPESLERQQQLEICGQCHFGTPDLRDAPYQFRPGDRLSSHYEEPPSDLAGGVHSSNQLTRLSISPCFIETEMTCTDCHNPHQSERGNRELFSQRCLKCHQSADCGMEPTLGARLADNCIDCHMPAGATGNMSVDTSDGKVFPPLRDHHIRIDRNATANYLRSLEQ